jgi:hypothetical protein
MITLGLFVPSLAGYAWPTGSRRYPALTALGAGLVGAPAAGWKPLVRLNQNTRSGDLVTGRQECLPYTSVVTRIALELFVNALAGYAWPTGSRRYPALTAL